MTGGSLRAADGALDAGDSRVTLGCLAGLAAGVNFRTRISGTAGRDVVLAALKALGVRVDADGSGIAVNGGALSAGTFDAEAPDTAVKAAFFLAGLAAQGEVRLRQPASGDDDLEVLLKAAGIAFEKVKEVGKDGYDLFLTGPQTAQPALHDLPGDPDVALYLLGAAAMLPQSELMVHGVGNDWKSRRVLELLRRFNAQIDIQVARSASKFAVRTVRVKKSELRRSRLAGDLTALFLDEVPFIAVLATQAAGETVIRNAEGLRKGPVDRLACVIENLRRMGARVGEMPDGLVVQGPVRLQGAELDAAGDVRVALALALAGLAAEGETQIARTGTMGEDFVALFERLSAVVNEKRGAS